MTDESPSPRELKIYFDNIDKKLDDLRAVVITRDLFAGTLDRVTRLESDQKEAERLGGQAIAESEKRLQEQVTTLRNNMVNAESDIRAAGRARMNMWIAGALTVSGSILVKLFFPTIP
jgi:hypothetical protein